MKLFCVYRESYTVDFRVHPIGSEYYVEEYFIGAFPKKDKAEEYIWKYLDDFIKENSITAVIKSDGENIILTYTSGEKDIFSIRELELGDIF